MTEQTEIIEQFWNGLMDSPIVMLGLPSQDAHSEPMSAQFEKTAQRAKTGGPLYFYTSRDNRLVQGLVQTNHAMAQFVGKGHDLFACLTGQLAIETDTKIIDKFWSEDIASWYKHGRNDPDLIMLRLDLAHAEFWSSDLGVSGKIKTFIGASLNNDDVDAKHLETAL